MTARAGPDQRTTIAMLALFMAVGVALRTVAIGRESLWVDEALTLVVARLPAFDLFFRSVDPSPGLYYILHDLVVPDAASPAGARRVALIAGILTIPAGYWLGKAAIDRTAGLGVAALIAVSAPLVDYSQEARAYSLLVLLITCSAAALIQAIPPQATGSATPVRRGMLALFLLTGVMSIYTHLVGWLWMGPAYLLAAMELHRRGIFGIKSALLATIGLGLVVLPELMRLAGYAFSPQNGFTWLIQPTLPQLVSMVGEAVLPIEMQRRWFEALPFAAALSAVIALNAVILAWVGTALSKGRHRLSAAIGRKSLTASVLLVLLSIPLVSWLIGLLVTPIVMERTILPMIPAFFVLIAAIAHLKGRGIALAIAVLVYGVDCLSSGLSRQKEPWADRVDIIKATASAQEPLIVCPFWRGPTLLHALEQRAASSTVIAVTPNGLALISRRGDQPFEWVDRYRRLVWEPDLPAYANDLRRPVNQQLTAASFIILRNGCRDEMWEQLVKWLGPGEWQVLARMERGADYPPSEITRFRPATAGPRPVLVDWKR